MRIGFLIGALTYYKLMGPIIDEAIGAGHEVTLLLRDPPELREGPKSYLRAHPGNVPKFRSGALQVKTWSTDESLLELCDRQSLDAVVSIWIYARDAALCRAVKARGVRWVALQVRIDPLLLPETAGVPDVACVFSPFWADSISRWERESGAQGGGHVQVTGFPEVDPMSAMDRERLRQAYGVPADKPVVVWMPHDYHARDLWEMLVFRRNWHLRFLWRALREGRKDLLSTLFTGATHARLVGAIRTFCDRNDAFLLVKSRQKDFPTRWDRQASDLFTYDRGYYPSTMLEILAIADLIIHVFSVTGMEAATAGVPALCLVPPKESTFFDEQHTWARIPHEMLHGAETIWRFPGVAASLSVDEAAQLLPSMRLSDFRMDPAQREAYTSRFVGQTDGYSARRVLDAALRGTEALSHG